MNREQELSERERLILHAVVHTYITTAEAVGSRAIVRRLGLDLSPATVRNVMADLEEAGFLQQLHTSSGRVPTDRGYRYYVDYLMRAQELTLQERARIEQELTSRLNDAEELMRQTSHLLALVSHQTGIVEGPDATNALVNHIELVPVSPTRIAVLVADSIGRVRTEMISSDQGFDAARVQRLNGFLNDNFRGVPVEKLSSSVQSRLRIFVDEQHELAEEALRILQMLPANRPGVLFLDGATQLFEQPEFQNVERAREVFSLLQERDRLAELLRAGMKVSERGGISVLIGSEASIGGVDGISVVSAQYAIGPRTVGTIGVLGPRRMPYHKVTSVVEYTAGLLGRLLTRLAT